MRMSTKTLHNIGFAAALAAPLVYLFGSMFMALAGAHGTIPFAEPITTNEFVEVQTYVEDGSTYKLEITESIEPLLANFRQEQSSLTIYNMEATINGAEVQQAILNYNSSNTNVVFYTYSTSTPYYPLAVLTDSYQLRTPQPWLFTGNKLTEPFVKLLHPYGTLYKSVETIVGENEPSAGANTAFTFGNFFWHDNFLSASGREVLNGTPLYGFEPVGALIRYLENNMLHLAPTPYGALVVGYVYYAAHVVIIDLVFWLSMFIPRLIKKIVSKFEGEASI